MYTLYIEEEPARESETWTLAEAATARVRRRRRARRRRGIAWFDCLRSVLVQARVRLLLHRVHARRPVTVDIGDQRAKRLLDVRRVQCGRFHVLNVSLFSVASGVVAEHGPDVTLVELVAHEDDAAVDTGVGTHFIVPSRKRVWTRSKATFLPLIKILECRRFENIENNERAESIAIVGFGDRHESLLSRWKNERTQVERDDDDGDDLPVSQICTLIVLPSTCTSFVENSTPMVERLSSENSLRVKRESRFDLPTPESPVSTILKM